MKAVLIVVLASLCTFGVRAETFDECTDKAWEDYSECFDNCGSKLGCQRKCVEKKNADLKACKLKDNAKADKSRVSTNRIEKYGTARTKVRSVQSFGEVCASILKDGAIYDIRNSMSNRNRIQQYYDFACSSQFESADEFKNVAAGLSIPVEGLPVPLNFNLSGDSQAFKSSMHEWCQTAFSKLTDQATRVQFEKTINQGMVQAFGKCIEEERKVLLEQTGAFISAVPQNQYLSSFGITIDFRPPIPGQFNKIISIEPKEVRCYVGNTMISASPDAPYIVKTNKHSMTCYKDGAIPQQISVNTLPTNATAWILLPGTKDDREILELRQTVLGLGQTISTQRRSQADLNNKIDTVVNRFSTTHGAQTAAPQTSSDPWEMGDQLCPAGSFVTGFAPTDRIRGKYGDGAILAFKVYCKKIGTP
jgi:hypothetical protein